MNEETKKIFMIGFAAAVIWYFFHNKGSIPYMKLFNSAAPNNGGNSAVWGYTTYNVPFVGGNPVAGSGVVAMDALPPSVINSGVGMAGWPNMGVSY